MLLGVARSAPIRRLTPGAFLKSRSAKYKNSNILPHSPARASREAVRLRSAASAVTADSAPARRVCLPITHSGCWIEPIPGILAFGTGVSAVRVLLLGRRGLSLTASAHSGVNTSDTLIALHEMQAPGTPPGENAPTDQHEASGSSSNSTDSLIQYVVLRRDMITELNWPLGAVVAQACHAAVDALGLAMQSNQADAQRYLAAGSNMRTVVLQVTGEEELLKLRDKLTQKQIGHKLWLEEPEKIPTALASVPITKNEGKIFKGLKLLSAYN